MGCGTFKGKDVCIRLSFATLIVVEVHKVAGDWISLRRIASMPQVVLSVRFLVGGCYIFAKFRVVLSLYHIHRNHAPVTIESLG